jgi:hypothetical protein
MEFLLLAAIFLTSSGFLVRAAVTPAPDAAIAQPAASVDVDGATITPQPKASGANVPVRQQFPGRRDGSHGESDVCVLCSGST